MTHRDPCGDVATHRVTEDDDPVVAKPATKTVQVISELIERVGLRSCQVGLAASAVVVEDEADAGRQRREVIAQVLVVRAWPAVTDVERPARSDDLVRQGDTVELDPLHEAISAQIRTAGADIARDNQPAHCALFMSDSTVAAKRARRSRGRASPATSG